MQLAKVDKTSKSLTCNCHNNIITAYNIYWEKKQARFLTRTSESPVRSNWSIFLCGQIQDVDHGNMATSEVIKFSSVCDFPETLLKSVVLGSYSEGKQSI